MAEIRIRNWDKWQTYRSDRGKPPWIKVHKRLLLDPNWSQLTDAQRGQLVTMWMIASDRDGVMPTPSGWRGDVTAAARMIAKLGFLDDQPDLQLFADLGFIIIDANVTSSRRQDDANVTPQGREGKEREVKERNTEYPNDTSGGEVSPDLSTSEKKTKQTPSQMIQAMAHERDQVEELHRKYGRPPWTPDQITAAKSWLKPLKKYTEAQLDLRRRNKASKRGNGELESVGSALANVIGGQS
jgi:hypothetical protein